MENQNVNLADLVGPQDSEIEALQAELVRVKEELIVVNRSDDLKAEQLDQLGNSIMALIGVKVTALIENRAFDIATDAMEEFNIHDHEYEIKDMIDERMPVGLDEDSRREDAKSLISEVLAGATITMSIE